MKPRIPEGGAIEDSSAMTMEQCSETMKKHLWKNSIDTSYTPDEFSEMLNKVGLNWSVGAEMMDSTITKN